MNTFQKITADLRPILQTEPFCEPGYIPSQCYLKNKVDLLKKIDILFEDFKEKTKNFSPIFYFSDGKSKALFQDSENLDAFVTQANRQEGRSGKLINLCEILEFFGDELHAHKEYVNRISNFLAEKDVGFVVSLGSGTVTDLVKAAVSELKEQGRQMCFVCVPTALTVTAFTSAFSVLDLGGAKKTFAAKAPDHTLWLEPLLVAAPQALTRAGYGDLLARFVAYGDWYLGWQAGVFQSYDEIAYHLMSPYVQPFLEVDPLTDSPLFHPLAQTSEAIQTLSAAVSMAGVAMTVSKETTPLSGFEHVISHALDFYSLTFGLPMPLHGEQVALGSLVSAQLYDWLLNLTKLPAPSKALMKMDAREFLVNLLKSMPGPAFVNENNQKNPDSDDLASAFIVEHFYGEFSKKHSRWLDKISFHKTQGLFAPNGEFWNHEVRPHLRKLVMTSQKMHGLVAAAGLPSSPEQLHPMRSAQVLRWAVRLSPFIRARFSLADLVFWMGYDPVTASGI